MIGEIKKEIAKLPLYAKSTPRPTVDYLDVIEILDKYNNQEKYNEYLKEMKELTTCTDYEVAHGNADYILCQLLTDLGYKEIIDLYKEVGKWYA